ncbi:MAG: hypothetical protein ABGY75_15495, partial [Gemmataceae bacterium]
DQAVGRDPARHRHPPAGEPAADAGDEPVQKKDGRVWVAPLLNWSHEDKHAYLDAHLLPRNPVVEKLCMSGECLCGAFARKGELDEIAFWYPETAARIRALEVRAAEAGVPCRWG